MSPAIPQARELKRTGSTADSPPRPQETPCDTPPFPSSSPPLAENFLRQGITTLIASLHSGDQPWPLEEFASGLEMAPNVGFFAGHTWTRKQVLGMENRAPTAEELEEMKALVDRSMREGALGLSTGLLYVPANFAETEEVIELAKVAAAHGGIYVSHMRNEASGLLESVREVIRIAEEADIPAQINHHKAAGAAQWGWSEHSLALIDSANAAGLTVTHDLYPYAASSTGSSILFPQWALAGGAGDFAARVVIAEGMRADIAVFDPEVIADRATFADPHQYSVGITDLVVNGVPVIREGGITGEKPGRWIRGPVRKPVS
ncbi:MAG: hypothetical protein F4022_05500 [Gemmatimonadetes bacterium]|nr:hypothetical protein [Gemmatimonadota bacterium]